MSVTLYMFKQSNSFTAFHPFTPSPLHSEVQPRLHDRHIPPTNSGAPNRARSYDLGVYWNYLVQRPLTILVPLALLIYSKILYYRILQCLYLNRFPIELHLPLCIQSTQLSQVQSKVRIDHCFYLSLYNMLKQHMPKYSFDYT